MKQQASLLTRIAWILVAAVAMCVTTAFNPTLAFAQPRTPSANAVSPCGRAAFGPVFAGILENVSQASLPACISGTSHLQNQVFTSWTAIKRLRDVRDMGLHLQQGVLVTALHTPAEVALAIYPALSASCQTMTQLTPGAPAVLVRHRAHLSKSAMRTHPMNPLRWFVSDSVNGPCDEGRYIEVRLADLANVQDLARFSNVVRDDGTALVNRVAAQLDNNATSLADARTAAMSVLTRANDANVDPMPASIYSPIASSCIARIASLPDTCVTPSTHISTAASPVVSGTNVVPISPSLPPASRAVLRSAPSRSTGWRLDWLHGGLFIFGLVGWGHKMRRKKSQDPAEEPRHSVPSEPLSDADSHAKGFAEGEAKGAIKGRRKVFEDASGGVVHSNDPALPDVVAVARLEEQLTAKQKLKEALDALDVEVKKLKDAKREQDTAQLRVVTPAATVPAVPHSRDKFNELKKECDRLKGYNSEAVEKIAQLNKDAEGMAVSAAAAQLELAAARGDVERLTADSAELHQQNMNAEAAAKSAQEKIKTLEGELATERDAAKKATEAVASRHVRTLEGPAVVAPVTIPPAQPAAVSRNERMLVAGIEGTARQMASEFDRGTPIYAMLLNGDIGPEDKLVHIGDAFKTKCDALRRYDTDVAKKVLNMVRRDTPRGLESKNLVDFQTIEEKHESDINEVGKSLLSACRQTDFHCRQQDKAPFDLHIDYGFLLSEGIKSFTTQHLKVMSGALLEMNAFLSGVLTEVSSSGFSIPSAGSHENTVRLSALSDPRQTVAVMGAAKSPENAKAPPVPLQAFLPSSHDFSSRSPTLQGEPLGPLQSAADATQVNGSMSIPVSYETWEDMEDRASLPPPVPAKNTK